MMKHTLSDLAPARGVRLRVEDQAYLTELVKQVDPPIPVATLVREIVEEWVQRKKSPPTPKKESKLRERLVLLRNRVIRLESQLQDLDATLEMLVQSIDAEVNS